jgi:hypothetical protein
MRRTRLTPLPLPAPPGVSPEACLVEGNACFLVGDQQLLAVAPQEGRVLWLHDVPRPPPAFYRLPRRARTSGKALWSRSDVLVHLSDAHTGVRLVAYEPRTGRRLWQTEVATPPPATWAENEPAWPDAPTEEIDAFLADADELVLALDRRSRRCMLWPDLKAPERRSQLDLVGFRWDTGAIAWERKIDGVEIPRLERKSLDLVLRTPEGIVSVSARTGDVRPVMLARGNQSWPRRVGTSVYASWHRGARVGIDRASTDEVTSGEWTRKGTRDTQLARVGGRFLLRANEGAVCGLGPELRAAWEARVRTYLYGMTLIGDDLVLGTTGAYGGAYGVSMTDGASLATHAVPRGGVWSVAPTPKDDGALLCTAQGLLAWKPRSGPPERVSSAYAEFVAGRVGDGSVVVCRAPDAGILYLEGL